MSKSILIIDADQGFTGTLQGPLSGSGFGVQVLADGKDALDVARARKPDLIVLCVELPNMSGYSICNKLKKDDELKGIPLVITSSEATPETFAQHKKLKTRAEEYLIKPFPAEQLMEKIGALIGMPDPPAASEEIVATGGDELDFDSLTAPPEPAQEATAMIEEDPLAALGAESLELDAPPPPPPPPAPPPAMAAKPKSAPPAPSALGNDLDDLLGPAPTPAARPAAPKPAAAPPAAAARPTITSTAPKPGASLPPRSSTSATMAAVGGPDPETERALKEARKENGDLKARLVALEGKLKLAEDQLARAQQSTESGKSTAQSAQKELLSLKEQINSRDKELLRLREEVFAKEKEVMERSEQVTELEQRASAAETARAEVETQVAALESRLQTAEQHLADAEASAEQRNADLTAQVQDLAGQLQDAQTRAQQVEAYESEINDLRARAEELEGSLRAAQEDAQKNEERLIKAHKKLKQDEQVREKLRRALDIAQQLVSDSVVDAGEDAGADA